MRAWAHLALIYSQVLAKSENKAIIEFRHVKAHSGVKDKRSYVNEWCDAEAKKQLRSKMAII